MIPRVLFDRSIFHKESFGILRKSSLAKTVSADKIRLLYTPLFIEETLQYGLKDQSRFKEQWRFITSLNNARWFKYTNEIIALELGGHISGRKYYLQPMARIQKSINDAPEVMSGTVLPEIFSAASDEMKRNDTIRHLLRQERITLRKSHPLQNFDFEWLFEKQAEWYIQNGLMKWHSGSQGYLNVWRKNRVKCRFTESHIRATLAILFLPIVDHQLKIDINDKSDAEQLAFLEWGDIFVSNDKKFVQDAFNLLYGNSSKRLMTLNDFLLFVEKV